VDAAVRVVICGEAFESSSSGGSPRWLASRGKKKRRALADELLPEFGCRRTQEVDASDAAATNLMRRFRFVVSAGSCATSEAGVGIDGIGRFSWVDSIRVTHASRNGNDAAGCFHRPSRSMIALSHPIPPR